MGIKSGSISLFCPEAFDLMGLCAQIVSAANYVENEKWARRENHGLSRKQNAKSALRLYALKLIELPQVRFATQIITRLY